MPRAVGTTITVVLSPRGEADEIVSILTDYAAVGMVGSFVWVDAADVGGAVIPATLVNGNQVVGTGLQHVLTGRHYARIRVLVLVPADAAGDRRVPRGTEQAFEQAVRAAAVGSPMTLLRLLFTRGAPELRGYDPALVLEGWHNLLVAPEDSAGPGLGSAVLGRLSDPVDTARHVAPVAAAVAGLWEGLDGSPFDDLAILPGSTVRAVRSYYRRLDAAGIEDRLRLALFDKAGRLPLPRSPHHPVVYVQDAAVATQTMARALWTKHRDILRSGRYDVGGEEAQTISARAALRTFLAFLWAALRNAPATWLSGMLGSLESAVASGVQHTVFGRTNSAYEVVANAQAASWQDIARGADELSVALGVGPQPNQIVQVDLSALWIDYVHGALTLSDGGRRSTGIEPVTVGAGVGVVANSADVVPSADDAFTAIPASLAAVVGAGTVTGGDVLGAADVRARLERAFTDPAAGVEARHAYERLFHWEQASRRSYAAQTSSILADFLGRARAEVGTLANQIRESADRTSIDEQLRQRQQAVATITRAIGATVFVVLVALAVIAGVGWVGWTFSLMVGGIVAAAYLVATIVLFVLGQRHLFAEVNLRKSQLGEIEVMHRNLAAALQDVSRLSTAYGQLLAWNRVLGQVLRAPLGPVQPARSQPVHIVDGLPRSTQVGVAAPQRHAADAAAHSLSQQLYGIGWLSGPWEQMVAAAARQMRSDPVGLFRMGGVGTGSPLDNWSHAVSVGTVRPDGAVSLWAKVQAMFDDPSGGMGDMLSSAIVNPATGERFSPSEFAAGVVTARSGPAAPFDAALFTETAATAGRSSVVIDDTAVDRRGLEFRASVVHVGDGLPTYDFAMFRLGDHSIQFEQTAKVKLPGIVVEDEEFCPPSRSMVF